MDDRRQQSVSVPVERRGDDGDRRESGSTRHLVREITEQRDRTSELIRQGDELIRNARATREAIEEQVCRILNAYVLVQRPEEADAGEEPT